ncbi:VOC family protein [Symbioplanes lichenis]|uniref:VOC family protein n=1 Tax=Symbioplanes lichenis TaxID=1629072 RepID=UPI002739A3EC|nr:VOC family protein [Actinoplanes lichenis]
MAKQRPAPSGGKAATRGRPSATPATPGPRRPVSGRAADPRPIPAPFLTPPPEAEPEAKPGPDPQAGPAPEPPAAAPEQQQRPRPTKNRAAGWAAPTGRRPANQRGVAKVPAPPTPRPQIVGLALQPMVHVADMAAAVAFYEAFGGELVHGDRDGEWVLMQVGTAQIGLVVRPPDPTRGESTVELNFSATMPLDRLERMLRERNVTVVETKTDPDLGTRLHVETPDGMPVKIHHVEPDLLV